jgi:HTH-type transcriptional regulator/antitoxin HigA
MTMEALKPIRTNADHAAALREVDALLAKNPKPKTALFDRLETLTILIETFERNHPDHRIDAPVDPIAAIEFHLDRLGKGPKDLESILHVSRSRVWEILKRHRALTLAQIRALVSALGIPPDRLIAEYRTAASTTKRPSSRPPAKPTKRSAHASVPH